MEQEKPQSKSTSAADVVVGIPDKALIEKAMEVYARTVMDEKPWWIRFQLSPEDRARRLDSNILYLKPKSFDPEF